jgi:hypothetical protein
MTVLRLRQVAHNSWSDFGSGQPRREEMCSPQVKLPNCPSPPNAWR